MLKVHSSTCFNRKSYIVIFFYYIFLLISLYKIIFAFSHIRFMIFKFACNEYISTVIVLKMLNDIDKNHIININIT